MKETVCAAAGVVGALMASAFGGWDTSMITLLIFMGIDYFTGLVVAGVFHASRNSQTGALESRAGFKGVCRKCVILLFVLIAHRLDLALGAAYVRDTVVIGFMANELISIVENAGLMGLPLPGAIAQAIELLDRRTGDSNDKEDDNGDSE